MSEIAIAEGLVLPENATTQVYAFLGRRGSGKTYAAGRLVEELIRAGRQVVILDPVGTWWGLRLAADGESEGLPIPILGGQHGDIPLEATAGSVVAQLVAERALSGVLDVSDFTGAEQRRFVADFATELLQRKKRNRSAILIVLEEAQEFAPQLVRPDHAKMVGAIEKMVKLGRNFGVGTAMVSQRPQAVNKDILNQTEVLFAFQLTGPQERKAIDRWVQEHGADRAVVGELPGLPIGTAIVWSPQWLRTFGRFRILPKRTYDASATPGAQAVRVADLSTIDLAEVQAAMAATIEKAKGEDPKELRRRLAAMTRERDELKALLDRAMEAAERSTEIAQEGRDVDEFVARRMAHWQARAQRAEEMVMEMATKLAVFVQDLNRTGEDDAEDEPGSHAPVQAISRPRGASPRVAAPATSSGLGKAERAILTVLAQYPQGRTKRQVALLTGYSSRGGGFNNAISALRRRGYIEGGQDSLRVTSAGLHSGIDWEPLPSGRDLIDHWLGRLGKAERAILEALVEAYPLSLRKDELGDRTGYATSGGGFNNALSRLRTLELIEGRTELRVSDDLMAQEGER